MYEGQDSGYEDDPQSELHGLCKTGSLGSVLTWLQSCDDGIEWYYEGETALHACVLSGREDAADVVSALVDHGCDVNAQNIADGNTALHLCVMHGNFPRDFDIVVALRSKNCDLGVRNKSLRTAYDLAVANNDFELAGTLDGTVPVESARDFYTRMMGRKYGPHIIEAVLNSDDAALQKYILLGGDSNYLNKYGNGAVHYAVTHTNLPVYDTLTILLDAGTNCNLKNEEEDTALNLCIKSDRLRATGQMARCVQLLVDAGAMSNIQDVDGRDACKIAEDKGYEDILLILNAKAKKPPPKKRESKKSVVFEPAPQKSVLLALRVVDVGRQPSNCTSLFSWHTCSHLMVTLEKSASAHPAVVCFMVVHSKSS
ncbi:hypothetical protein RRG08_056358 [Elysia crispata]|uniref:Ankyrin repeat protein n=1 Tax=Elysia crispata TaxID=231223 RepID=A0AAE1D2F7_9GAST|nr:hypothetical protein RRG08_056358 [Elysia crispata]